MNNVLFIYEREMPTIRLLKEKYKVLTLCHVFFLPLKDVKKKIINTADIIIFVRPSDPLSFVIAKAAKEANKVVVFYTDDDLLGLPKSSPFSKSRKRWMQKVAEWSDFVLAANDNICNKYAELVKTKRYVQTITSVDYVDKNCIALKLSEQSKIVKIVYAAGNGHEHIFEKYISPIVPNLIERYGNKISIDFVGVHPHVEGYSSDKIRYINGMSLEDYRLFMSKQLYDIGLAPLEDNDFNKSKHYNKYLEYTSSGIVGIYSNNEPYTKAVINNYNGLLVSNETKKWFEAICYLIENSDERNRMLKNASEHILENYTEEKFVEKIYKDIPELTASMERKTAHLCLAIEKIKYYAFLIKDKVYLLNFYWNNNRKYIYEKINFNRRNSE